jgi:hypothetical protein
MKMVGDTMPRVGYRYRILWYTGLYDAVLGVILLILMMYSVYDADAVLKNVFGMRKVGPIAGNCWAQAAVAFGMHGYADLMNGIEQMKISANPSGKQIPKVVTVWNTTRFCISFLWALTLLKGLTTYHAETAGYPFAALALISILCLDTMVIRPAAIYCQRSHDDAYPGPAGQEEKEWYSYSMVQRCCRCVFFYEGILSGCSGAVYFIFPQLFTWLYGIDEAADLVALWSLANFGVLVTTFGLYQLNAEIDTRWGHVLWWLILDIVWMVVYVQGIRRQLGHFEPLTLSGANFWCHSAFHADSSLALARAIFLGTLLIGRKSLKPKSK